MKINDDWLSLSEAAELVGVHPSTVRLSRNNSITHETKKSSHFVRALFFNSRKLLASSGHRVDFTGTRAACARDFIDGAFAEGNRENPTVINDRIGLGQA